MTGLLRRRRARRAVLHAAVEWERRRLTVGPEAYGEAVKALVDAVKAYHREARS